MLSSVVGGGPSPARSAVRRACELFSAGFHYQLILRLPVMAQAMTKRRFQVRRPSRIFRRMVKVREGFLVVESGSHVTKVGPTILGNVRILMQHMFNARIAMNRIFKLIVLGRPRVNVSDPIRCHLRDREHASNSKRFLRGVVNSNVNVRVNSVTVSHQRGPKDTRLLFKSGNQIERVNHSRLFRVRVALFHLPRGKVNRHFLARRRPMRAGPFNASRQRQFRVVNSLSGKSSRLLSQPMTAVLREKGSRGLNPFISRRLRVENNHLSRVNGPSNFRPFPSNENIRVTELTGTCSPPYLTRLISGDHVRKYVSRSVLYQGLRSHSFQGIFKGEPIAICRGVPLRRTHTIPQVARFGDHVTIRVVRSGALNMTSNIKDWWVVSDEVLCFKLCAQGDPGCGGCRGAGSFRIGVFLLVDRGCGVNQVEGHFGLEFRLSFEEGSVCVAIVLLVAFSCVSVAYCQVCPSTVEETSCYSIHGGVVA